MIQSCSKVATLLHTQRMVCNYLYHSNPETSMLFSSPTDTHFQISQDQLGFVFSIKVYFHLVTAIQVSVCSMDSLIALSNQDCQSEEMQDHLEVYLSL